MTLQPRAAIEQAEKGLGLAPKFGADGLLGWMDAKALRHTIATREAHHFSRSREVLWHKGATSALVQQVVEMRIEDEHDALWLRVQVQPGAHSPSASCHVGHRSCFYRAIDAETGALRFVENRKSFDPQVVCGDASNPALP